MADSDKTVAYGVSADPSGFEKGMQSAADSAKNAASQIDNSFKKVQETFAGVQKVLLGLAAVVAGGGVFKAIITEAADWNHEAAKMAKQLGVTSEQASVLNVALKHLGIDSETYTGAAAKMSKQIFSHAQAFETLGVAIKDTTTGAYRPVTEVMAEVNQKLAEIKNPIEQNIAGMQVYGKGWQEVRSILKLTKEEMDHAEERARQLGLVVGPEGAEAAKVYKEQMRDLGLVSKSLTVQLGNQLLPVFTQTGRFLAEEGPAAGKVFADILQALSFATASVWLALKDMGDGLGALAAQAAALLSGDIEGFKAIGRARDEEAAKNEAAYERLKKRFSEGVPTAKSAAPVDDGTHLDFTKEGGDKSRVGEWEAALAEKRAAIARESMEEGQLRELGKAEELRYWQDVKAMAGLSVAERAQVSKKAAEVETGMVRDSFEQKVRLLEAEAAHYKNNTDRRLELEREIQSKYAEGTKGYEEAQKRINEIERQSLEQDKQVAQQKAEVIRASQLAAIQGAEQAARLEFELGNIRKQQLLTLEQQFEDQRYNIAQQALQQRLALAKKLEEEFPDRNKVEIAKLNAEIEALMEQHEQRKRAIRGNEVLEATANSRQIYTALTSSMQSGLSQMMQGMTTFAGFMKAVWQSVAAAVADVLARMVMNYIKETVVMAGIKKALAVFDIGTDAARAGAGAAASAASTPVVGWLMAPAAAAATFAMAGAFAGSVPAFTAAGGFDIPGTVNPITQLHANEMVLPAKHADVIRNMADEGSGGGGTGGGDVHLHVHATDAQSVARLFRDNGEHIVSALKQQHRNFAFTSKP